MSDFVLQTNHIVQMNAETSEVKDSSNDDVFIELAQAWDFVKKWYNFRQNDNNNDTNVARVKFTRCKSRNSSNRLDSNEPKSRRIFFHDLPVGYYYADLSYL